MWTSSISFSVARNGKYILRGVALLLIAVLVIDYLSIKTNFPAGSQERWSIYQNIPWEALRNLGRSCGESRKLVGNSANESRKRILCWVPTGPQNHESKATHVKRTWGVRCDKLIFISTQTDVELGAIAMPNVKEGRDWLWAKTKAALKYIWEKHRNEYDWFLKADDDTYMIMENLRYFLKDYDTSQAYYFGCRLQYQNIKPSVNFGGAGYVLSREALRIFVQQALPDAEKCKQEHDGDEDTELGKCLANVGITPADTRDKEGKHRFLHSYPEYHFGLAQGKWSDVRDYEWPGLNCCSPGIISFHHVGPETLYALEFLIYHFHLYGSDETILRRGDFT